MIAVMVVWRDGEWLPLMGSVSARRASRPPAPHVRRLLAWLIDFVLVMLAGALLGQPFPLAIPVALFVTYHTLAVRLTGRTIGKAALGLKVARDARSPTFWWCFGRASVGYFGCTLLGLGLLPALRNERHQTLHDEVFDSEVVFEDEGRLDVRTALRRLGDFAQMREEQATRRRTALGIAVVGVLWGWLRSLTEGVAGVLDWLGGHGAGGGPSPLAALGARAKALVAVAATGVSAATVAVLPPVADAAEWLFEPRYYIGGPDGYATPEDAIAAFAREEDWAGRDWDYQGDCATATREIRGRGWCARPSRAAR